MEKHIHEYIQHARRKKFKESTIRDYEVFLRGFMKFLQNQYPEIQEITDIDREIILAYEKHLLTEKDGRGKVMTRTRRRRYLSNLKNFFEYHVKAENIYRNPAGNIVLPKEKRTIIKDFLTVDEMDVLLKTCDGEDLRSIRDRAILELLYSTGARADELCHIELSDIDFYESLLLIRKGKLDKERLLPIGESAKYWCVQYINHVRTELIAEDTEVLFLTMKGGAIKPYTLNLLVKEYAEKAGIEKTVTTHTFRHSFANHLLKGRADLRYIQQLMGHKSISSSEKYLKTEITDLKEVLQRCHPREQEDW